MELGKVGAYPMRGSSVYSVVTATSFIRWEIDAEEGGRVITLMPFVVLHRRPN